MTVQSRTTLKSYFISGATPTEANFSDLIDSTLLVEDLVTTLNSTSTTDPLSANLGAVLSDSIDDLDTRVTTLEGAENDFVSNYYTKTEVDNIFAGVDGIIAALPFSDQISDINAEIAVINTTLSDKADSIHTHEVSEVNGLQALLDAKASLVELNAVKEDLIDSINAIDGGGGTVDLSGINASIDALNAQVNEIESELSDLAPINHVHDDIYSKTEVDTLIDSVDTFRDHVHSHEDITGLGGEIEAKTTLLVQDHALLQNNPHNVTKEQLGLDKVENLTPEEIFESADFVTQSTVDAVEQQIADHKQAYNPHSITKDTIGLSNVLNLNVTELFDAHLAEENPHNIDLTYFDVYSTAEADARMQFYIESSRYAFTPLSNNDPAGIVGDFGYDPSNLYFKIADTEWKKLPFIPVYIQRPATQDDVDAGLATEVGELIWVNEVSLPEINRISTTENFSITNVEGTPVITINEDGELELFNTTIDNVTIEGDTVINRTIASSTDVVEILDNTIVTGDFSVTGDTVINQNIASITDKIVLQNNTEIEGDTVITGGLTLGDTLSSSTEVLNLDDNVTIGGSTTVNGEFTVTNESGDSVFNVTREGNITLAGAEITNNLTVEGHVTSAEVNTNDITITNQAGEVLLEIQEDGDVYLRSVEITNGTANFSSLTSSESNLRYIDTQEIEIWNQAKYDGSNNTQKSIKVLPSFGSFNGVELVPDRIQVLGLSTNLVAYLSDLPDLSGYVLRSELENSSGGGSGGGGTEAGGSETDLVLGGFSGEDSGYAYSSDGKYAVNYGPDGQYGTADDGNEEYWSLISTPTSINTGLIINYGDPETNPFVRYNVNLSTWEIFDGTYLYEYDQASELIVKSEGLLPAPSISYNSTTNKWVVEQGGLLGNFEIEDTFSKTESDNRYIQQGDAYTKSESDSTFAPSDYIPQEVQYPSSGDNPYIKYDPLAGEWYAFNGTTVEVIGASTTVVNEGDTVTNTTVLNQTVVQQSLTVDGTSGGEENGYAYTEYDDGSGTFVAIKYSIDYGADGTFGTSDDDDAEDYFEVDASGYSNAGLTVNAGLTPNPSIVYDLSNNKWLVDDGDSNGTFYLKDVDAAVTALVNSAPETLNTLDELAAALGDDANFATTTSTALGNRVRVDTNAQGLNATQKSNARTNIDAASSSHNHSGTYLTENQIKALLYSA